MRKLNLSQRKLLGEFLSNLSIALVSVAVISQIFIQKKLKFTILDKWSF